MHFSLDNLVKVVYNLHCRMRGEIYIVSNIAAMRVLPHRRQTSSPAAHRRREMNQFIGCWVEKMDNGKWAICWPDCSYLETGFGSKAAATAALNRYLYDEQEKRHANT